jgi:hypothetical protein
VVIRGPETPPARRSTDEPLFVMTTKQMGEIRSKLAKMLHEQLGQHLAGTLLAAGALSARLIRRHAPEATEASYLLEMLMRANKELNCLIRHLDSGKPR